MGVVLVLVGLYYGVINPTMAKKKATLAKIGELKESLEKANREIDQMSKDRKTNLEAVLTIKSLSDKYLLKPRLGNFLLSATEIIEEQAKRIGLTVQVRDVGLGPVVPERAPPVKAYTAHVSVICGYRDLIRFIREIETDNPMICVMNISIQGRASPDVETHSIGFDVQWPVWADQEMPSNLEAQLAAMGANEKRGAK
jgi:hypothetical protein